MTIWSKGPATDSGSRVSVTAATGPWAPPLLGLLIPEPGPHILDRHRSPSAQLADPMGNIPARSPRLATRCFVGFRAQGRGLGCIVALALSLLSQTIRRLRAGPGRAGPLTLPATQRAGAPRLLGENGLSSCHPSVFI